jgi:hypothetical protein
MTRTDERSEKATPTESRAEVYFEHDRVRERSEVLSPRPQDANSINQLFRRL